MSQPNLSDNAATTIYVSVRMPIDLRAQVEAHRVALSLAAGGAAVAFSFATFHLLQAGLDAQGTVQQ